MNLPAYFPAWMYLYFATFGSIAIVLLVLIFWTWMKSIRLIDGFLRTCLTWNMVGYFFMFCAAWSACESAPDPAICSVQIYPCISHSSLGPPRPWECSCR